MLRTPGTPFAEALDEHEFLATVTTMRPALSAVALRIVGNEQDAADVVQDSYLRAWRALPSFRGESKLSTWLHTIVVNRALSALQRSRQRPAGRLTEIDEAHLGDPGSLCDPHAVAEQAELRSALLVAVRSLPDPLRDVVVAREVRGLTHDQIADELGISETASKVRLHRARKQLRPLLQDRLDDDPDAGTRQPIGA